MRNEPSARWIHRQIINHAAHEKNETQKSVKLWGWIFHQLSIRCCFILLAIYTPKKCKVSRETDAKIFSRKKSDNTAELKRFGAFLEARHLDKREKTYQPFLYFYRLNGQCTITQTPATHTSPLPCKLTLPKLGKRHSVDVCKMLERESEEKCSVKMLTRRSEVFYIERQTAGDACVGAGTNNCAEFSAQFQRSQITVECILSREEERQGREVNKLAKQVIKWSK